MNRNGNTNGNIDYLPFMFGIETIDTEHQRLIGIFNRMIEKASKNEFADFRKIVEELEEYSHYHFNTEETLMKKADFDEIEEHIFQHQIFRQKINDFRTSVLFESSTLKTDIVNFLRKWFLKHIMEEDSKYVPAILKYLSQENTFNPH